MTEYKYTNDITDGDLLRLEIFSVAVDCDPVDAASCWMNESGNYTTAWNHDGGASGIFQVMPPILKGLGYRPDITDNDARSAQFRTETYSEQLRWAQRYYTPYKGKLKNSASFYVATFLPADINYASTGNLDTVLVSKVNGQERRGWAYESNCGFDENHDLKITVGELEDAIERACHSNRWFEISDRLHEQLNRVPPAHLIATPKFSPMWVQQVLTKLGYNVGTCDGIVGMNTRNGIKAFQKDHNLSVDGIIGPATRGALTEELDKKSITI